MNLHRTEPGSAPRLLVRSRVETILALLVVAAGLTGRTLCCLNTPVRASRPPEPPVLVEVEMPEPVAEPVPLPPLPAA